MRRKTKFIIRQILLIVIGVPAVGFATLRFSLMPFANYFDRKYPHDGQNSLGAFAAALGLGIVAALVTFATMLAWTIRKSDRLQSEAIRTELTETQ